MGDVLFCAVNMKIWLLIAALLTAIAVLTNKNFPKISSMMILLALVSVGGFRLCYNRYGEYVQQGEQKTMCGIAVMTEPVTRGKVIAFDGLVYASENENMVGTRVRVSMLRDTITKKYEQIHLGEGVRGVVGLSPLQEWHRLNTHFSYVKWLRTRGFTCRAFVPIGTWERENIGVENVGLMELMKMRVLAFRQRILERIEASGMDHNAFAVATAMALGNKAALTPEIREEYSMAGASHVLALSGVHLSIIYALLSVFFKRRKLWSSMLLLMMIWGYVVFAGMPVSVLRAACMLTLWEILRLASNNQRALNVLGATACIMVMVSPQCIWDVGFQMSFAAVLAIILLMDPFRRIMPEKWKYANKKKQKTMTRQEKMKYKVLRGCWHAIAISISAQIGSLPLGVYYFGIIPFCFLLTNLVMVIAVPLILWVTMGMAVVVTVDIVAGVGNGLVTVMLGQLLSWIAGGVNCILGAIAGLPFASVDDVHITNVQLVAWYVIAVVVVAWVNRRAWK